MYEINITENIKDFIYKVDDSSKLTVQSQYDSIDEFFSDTINETNNDNILTIISVDTKTPIITLEKSIVDNKTSFKFIVDITNTNSDNFIIRTTIRSNDHFKQLIDQTTEALQIYPEFSKYASDLETCSF